MFLPSRKLRRNQRMGSHRFKTTYEKHKKKPSTTMDEGAPKPAPLNPLTRSQRLKRWKTHTKQ
jgi:hypothetical protein